MMGLYWYDTEFIESGYGKPIQLISIGMVDEEGREYYAICKDFNPKDANDWVRKNVLSQLEISPENGKPIGVIRDELSDFIGDDPKPEFWGYYSAYDHVMLSMIWGRMVDLPKNFPQYTKDLKQLADDLGNPELPEQKDEEHNSLNDAKWNLIVYNFLTNYKFTKKKYNLKYFRDIMKQREKE